ncbi:hypothetical protein OUZ56_011907 [Daphnia magna]|uniref:CCHC-type domain-containing protein n=1 Tax=Daphnia magna TaxID=35525 RepID=A0ABQ9Z1H9_9CRUS|nr:hypothetical protein OUZ56_011907 [Daphnia magna]
MVADTNKYALRMENENEEIHKREFVNAVNDHSGPSEIQKLQVMIQEQNEKICALTMKKTDNPGFDLPTEIRQLSHNVARLMEQFNDYEQPPNNLFRHGQESQSYDRPFQKYDRPPTTATCHFCGIKGHLMKDCPLDISVEDCNITRKLKKGEDRQMSFVDGKGTLNTEPPTSGTWFSTVSPSVINCALEDITLIRQGDDNIKDTPLGKANLILTSVGETGASWLTGQ